MSEFDQFVIGFLKNSCNDITPFEVFSKMAKTLEQERNLKKDARDWVERIISLHNKIKN
jgi:predicted GIY-YIG superfamily endonuclease